MGKFDELLKKQKKENIKNRKLLSHNQKTKNINDLLPYDNRAFLNLVNFISERLISQEA